MPFNSYVFLCLFLPITVVLFYLIAKYTRTTWAVWFLSAASLVFLGYYDYRYPLFLLGAIFVDYGLIRLLYRTDRLNKLKIVFVVGLCIDLGALILMKYTGFFSEILTSLRLTAHTVEWLFVPLGISFYTFTRIDFLFETYREQSLVIQNNAEKVGKQKEWCLRDYIFQITFFPKLLQGPIVIRKDLEVQLEKEGFGRFAPDTFREGIIFFSVGLFKKVMIADVLSGVVDWGYTYTDLLNSSNLILILIFYTLQLYFDFSGYCDMAEGISLFFGLSLPQNFNSPLRSINIQDFWKRWHMTLTRFFTRNIYIPLGGNRKGKLRMYGSIFLIFFLSGLWHGASVTFVIWGILHGIVSIFTRMWHNLKDKKNLYFPEGILKKIVRLIAGFFTFCFVVLAFGIFRADTIQQFSVFVERIKMLEITPVYQDIWDFLTLPELLYFIKIFPGGSEFLQTGIGQIVPGACFLFVVALITFFGKNLYQFREEGKMNRKNSAFSYLIMAGCSIMVIWSMISFSEVSSFLYFQF